MTLSSTAFSASWAILCDRFNRQFNDATVRIYHKTLSAELTDEQFQKACAAAFRFEVFFPTPQQLIEYGLGGRDASSRALKRWVEMMEAAQAGETATQDKLERKLLMRATNGQPLGSIPHKELPWVEKAWVRLYTDHLMELAQNNAPALAPLTVQELPNASD
ncbi:hypothetical protein [Deinococcus humi]|uniref:Uncharacterized protein n=1 Tax=Deinococcus humi TaxID=662880 RepID=A0A7W8JQP2_9DEIO|nr:hypothetical protein [Deinococcus humi]MBB5361369.1 hypothetical protein [Deinococcus humi]GGO19725.1 hypothetical protein GCM10008949_04310 [Deinococcus humi]